LGTAGVGVLVAAVGIALAVKSALRANSWKRTDATVTRVETQSRVDSGNDHFFFNLYTFRYDAAGTTRESILPSPMQNSHEEEVRSRLKSHPPGTHREIFYNPANPAEIGWPAGGGYAVAFAFGAMGLLFVVAGAIVWYVSQPAEW
jgi:hypothetical protein